VRSFEQSVAERHLDGAAPIGAGRCAAFAAEFPSETWTHCVRERPGYEAPPVRDDWEAKLPCTPVQIKAKSITFFIQLGIVVLLPGLVHQCCQRRQYRLFAWRNSDLLGEQNVGAVRLVKQRFPFRQ